MALLSRSVASPQVFGMRSISMFEVLSETLVQDLSNDKDVQTWMEALKADPLVKTGTAVTKEASFYLKTILRTSTAILNTAMLPITYPLSKLLPARRHELTPCPFESRKDVVISGAGDIAIRRQNIIEKMLLGLKNAGNRMSVSKYGAIRGAHRAALALISTPLTLLAEPSKENLVLMAIQRYFPSFTTAEFATWLEESFLPFLLTAYIGGRTNDLKQVAGATVVQERTQAVSEYVLSGMRVMSRFLSVSDVSILDFDFSNHMPLLSVRCYADHTEEVVTKSGVTVMGSPEDVKRSEFVVALKIDNSGSEPVWKAHELHVGTQMNRI